MNARHRHIKERKREIFSYGQFNNQQHNKSHKEFTILFTVHENDVKFMVRAKDTKKLNMKMKTGQATALNVKMTMNRCTS